MVKSQYLASRNDDVLWDSEIATPWGESNKPAYIGLQLEGVDVAQLELQWDGKGRARMVVALRKSDSEGEDTGESNKYKTALAYIGNDVVVKE